MTAPQIIARTLTFQFAPSVSATTGLPAVMEVAVIPLASATDPQAGAIFAGSLQTAEVELSNAVNTCDFELIPSNAAGLSQPINYRAMWRAGILGATTTVDFAMPDADLTWAALIAGVGNIINGEVYLQQSDLGVPGRVARLDVNGNVINSAGVICATLDDLSSVTGNITAETNAREVAVAQLSGNLLAQMATQNAATLSTATDNINNAIATINSDIANERGSRIDGDADLQQQINTNLTAQQAVNVTVSGNLSTINTTLPDKADLVSGVVPLDQIPDAILTSAVPAANQAAMLALSPTIIHSGDLCVRPDGIFLLTTNDPSQLANWVSLTIVSSVNGYRGIIELVASDVGAIPVGGAIAQSQVTGLSTAFSNKANQTDLATLSSLVTGILDDPTYVHLVDGVIPSTLLDDNMVYLNSSGQLVEKDGDLIPLGTGGSGAVFSVNGQTGLVVLTASSVGAIATSATNIGQNQITGLTTALNAKADLTGPGNTVPLAELPSLPMSQITGLSTSLSNKADLVSGTVPLAEIPTLPTSQITNLSALISGNSLTTTSNAVNRIASLESQIVSGGGGGGGGDGVGTQAEFYTSANTTTAVTGPNFTSTVNIHSPWGIDSDGTITGQTGTWYYLYTGVRSVDAAYAYISANGHLQLHLWNESGPADPTYALESDLTALTTTVSTKANASDLATTNATVATKANQSDLTALGMTVSTLATEADLTALATTVGTKANESDLETTNATIATLATQASVTALTTTVGTLATEASVAANTTAISTINTTLSNKADLVSGTVPVSELPALPISQITNLSTSLTAKADLVSGTVPLAEMPQNIPQSYISGLGTTLGAKADLVSGVVPLSQIPTAALPNVEIVANQAAMLALTTAQVQYGDLCLITGTSAAGTYILTASDPSQLANWTELTTGTPPVTSVNSYTGTVVLQASDVGALASNASIPISQISGLSTELATFATTSALTSGLVGKTAFTDVENLISASSFTKRADYVASGVLSSLSGLQAVDGILIPSGAIILVTDQPSSVNNGLWVSSSSSWVRAPDFATGSYLSKDTLVFVSNQTSASPGTTNNNTIWQMSDASGFIDTAANNWLKIGWTAAPFVPVAGNGITVAGSTLSANVTAGQGILSTATGLQADPNVLPRKKVLPVPSGTLAEVTHGLGSLTPIVSIWDTSVTPNELTLAGMVATDSNNITIEFAAGINVGQFNVVIMA